MDKKISEKQYLRLLKKSTTLNLKGFKDQDKKVNGKLCFDQDYNLKFDKEVVGVKKLKNQKKTCPKCGKGEIIKGKHAYGCSNYKQGCDFVFSYSKLRELAKGQLLTEKLVMDILAS